METDFIFRNKFKYKKIKNCNNIIKFKTIFHFILLLFGIILIIFFIFNNIDNRKLLKQILINVNSNKNDTGLFNIKNKEEDIKNRINLLKTITNNNPYIYKHIEDCLLNMHDHTINSLPHNNPKFHWSKIGICGNNERTENLKPLENLIKENGHFSEKNRILKIDVEDSEWNSLNDLNEDILTQFKYITIEYHFFEPSKEELYYNVLKKYINLIKHFISVVIIEEVFLH